MNQRHLPSYALTLVHASSANVTYRQYVTALSLPAGDIRAWSVPGALGAFIKEAKAALAKIAEASGESIDALMEAFKSKDLFTVFKACGFSLKKLYQAVTSLTGLIPKGIQSVFQALQDSKVFQALKSGTMKIDEFFAEHPILQKLVGPALAGLLLWIWLNSAFTGDPDFDLDISSVAAALAGRFSIQDLFASPAGLTSLAALGAGFTGIGAVWLGTNIANLILALLFTGAKKAKETELFKRLKTAITPVRVHAAASVEASDLDALRGSKLLSMLGIKGAELVDHTEGYLIFSVNSFYAALTPLTKFYGHPKNESNASWLTKRLVWSIPEVNGQVLLTQIGNTTSMIVFKQL
jgi:hypothetical protein